MAYTITELYRAEPSAPPLPGMMGSFDPSAGRNHLALLDHVARLEAGSAFIALTLWGVGSLLLVLLHGPAFVPVAAAFTACCAWALRLSDAGQWGRADGASDGIAGRSSFLPLEQILAVALMMANVLASLLRLLGP